MTVKTFYEAEDNIKTSMGRSFLGERVVFRGADLHFDLCNMDWLELMTFGITGRRLTAPEVKVLNYLWVATSYPDKSIWPNHVAALAGTGRTTPGLAMSAGMASCEAAIFGSGPMRRCIDFMIRAKIAIDTGVELERFVEEELENNKVIYGYGRPLAKTDERVPHLVKFVLASGMENTEHFFLAMKVANILKEKKNISMNGAALYAALGADMGFTPEQFHLLVTPLVYAGMPPCYEEARHNAEGSFLPVRCDRINYTGSKKREW